jgi:AraC-like DNA-binding protein
MSEPTEFITPRFFSGQEKYPLLRVDDFSYVEYRHCVNQYRNRIIVTSYLFVVLLSGEKIIHTADGDLSIKAGQAFFARKGSYLFSEILASQDEYRTLVFFIDDSFLKQFLERYSRLLNGRSVGAVKQIFAIPVSPLLKASIDSVLPFFLHRSGLSHQLLRLKFEELLLHIVDADPEGDFLGFLHAQYSARKRELQALMERYVLKRVTIHELAMLSGRSLSAFKREFRETFQDSPRRWITNRRLEHAKMLLAGSDLNDLRVGEICIEAGFDNFSHFSQIFKKKYGFSPSSLQKIRN